MRAQQHAASAPATTTPNATSNLFCIVISITVYASTPPFDGRVPNFQLYHPKSQPADCQLLLWFERNSALVQCGLLLVLVLLLLLVLVVVVLLLSLLLLLLLLPQYC